jgi:hypothetical protein
MNIIRKVSLCRASIHMYNEVRKNNSHNLIMIRRERGEFGQAGGDHCQRHQTHRAGHQQELDILTSLIFGVKGIWHSETLELQIFVGQVCITLAIIVQ